MDERRYLELIRGTRRGPLAAALRGGLRLASGAFLLGSAARGAAYSSGLLRVHPAPLPVISVGNLTTGGTGKTPLVIHLARALQSRGLKVAVLARGYGAAQEGELNDELRLIAAEVPDALVLPGRDRVASALEASRQGAQVLLLDDGFQHRRLARHCDVVLIDALDPWGPAGVLPRGLLREGRSALRRADVVVLSRVEGVDASRLAALEAEVRAAGFRGPLLRQRSIPVGLRPLAPPGDPRAAEGLAGARVLAACGIGNPEAFRRTLLGLGCQLLALEVFPDHHAYSCCDVERLEELARELEVERVVVTAKDAVKLAPIVSGCAAVEGAPGGAVSWEALAIEARLEPADATETILERVFSERPAE